MKFERALFIGLSQFRCSTWAGVIRQIPMIMRRQEKDLICSMTVFQSQKMTWSLQLARTPEVCRSPRIQNITLSLLPHSIERVRAHAKYTTRVGVFLSLLRLWRPSTSYQVYRTSGHLSSSKRSVRSICECVCVIDQGLADEGYYRTIHRTKKPCEVPNPCSP